MQTSSLAPIVLFVYNRPEHTLRTLQALLDNSLANQSHLIVYSDAAKKEQDLDKVNAVRHLVSNTKGFASLQLIASEYNKGLSQSIIQGVSEVFETYDRVIVLEDDLLVSPDFLEYMNYALGAYEAVEQVYSISGYTFPSNALKEVTSPSFLYPRPTSWGWATWKSIWQEVDWEVKDFSTFKHDKKSIQQFLRGGDDLFMMLLKQQQGLIQSWAIRFTYHHFKHHAYSVYLKHSKVQSIGTDNSGTNLPSTTKYDTATHLGFDRTIETRGNDHWIYALSRFYSPSIQRRIINTFKFGLSSWYTASKK